MTDKAPKYPEDFGEGVEYDYHVSKKQKILICCLVGFSILAFYQYYQLQTALKTTDWTLDPNYNWTCKNLTIYENTMEAGTKATGTEFPKQLAKNISDKRLELNCQ